MVQGADLEKKDWIETLPRSLQQPQRSLSARPKGSIAHDHLFTSKH